MTRNTTPPSPGSIAAVECHSSDAILAHPRFDAAREAYVDFVLRTYREEPTLNRLLIDQGNQYVFFVLVCLHAGFVEADRSTWPTMRLLQNTMESLGVSSSRRVHSIVTRLMAEGYVGAEKAASDNRVRLLHPTEKMLAYDRESLVGFYVALDAMFPEPGYGPPMRRDPAFQKAQRLASLGMIAHSARFIMANPTIRYFLPREAGVPILIQLIKLCGHHADQSSPRVSFAQIGSNFGVSRTHVRTLLQGAEELGFARLDGNCVALTQQCHADFDRFVADCMSGNDLIYRLAMASPAPSRLGTRP